MIARILVGAAMAYLFVGLALFPRWTVDDAYITYRYAENLARHGEFVFNVGEDPVEGYTGVLLPVVVAGAVAAGADADSASKVVGSACAIAMVLLLYFAARTAGVRAWIAGAAALVFAATPSVLTHALGGLETMLFAALVLASVWTLARAIDEPASDTRLAGSLVALLLTCLARPEGAALAAPSLAALAYVGLREGRARLGRRALIAAALFAAPALAYFAWRYQYYGQLMPNTYYAKWHWRTNTDTLRLAASFAAYQLALPVAAALSLALVRPRATMAQLARSKRSVLWAAGVTAVFALLVIAQYARSALIMNFSHRFFVPFLALGLLAAAVIASAAITAIDAGPTAPSRARVGVAVAVAAALLAGQGAVDARALGRDRAFAVATTALLAEEHLRVANLLRERVPRDEWVVVVVDSGAIPYFAGCRTLDFGGLNDEYIGRRFYNAHPEPDIIEYFYRFHAGAVVVTSARPDRIDGPEPTRVFEDPRFADYVQVACFGSPGYPNYYQLVYLRSDLARNAAGAAAASAAGDHADDVVKDAAVGR